MIGSGDGWWDHSSNARILFGPGRLDELPSLVGSRRALIVTTPGATLRGLKDRVWALLGVNAAMVVDTVAPNPEIEAIEQHSRMLSGGTYEVIVGVGGGSAIDTAKALSFTLSSGAHERLRAHFEGGAPLPKATPVPVVAVPTTAGTGSEVTPFTTIWDMQRERKYSLSVPGLQPEAAILDPALTLSVPEDVAVATGLDALSHAFESVWNRNATPITSAYALKAIGTIIETLPAVVEAPHKLENRTKMMEASLLAGLAISRTRTALAHSMSYPMTARYGLPHGLACGFTLPAVLDFNAQVDDGRLADAAAWLGFASVRALRDGLERFLARLGVEARVREHVRAVDDLLELAPYMLAPGRAENNIRLAGIDDVGHILVTAWAARARV